MSTDKNKEIAVPFGAGLAVGALVAGLGRALWTIAVATGVGYAVYSLMPKSKENSECKPGQKQN